MMSGIVRTEYSRSARDVRERDTFIRGIHSYRRAMPLRLTIESKGDNMKCPRPLDYWYEPYRDDGDDRLLAETEIAGDEDNG